MNYIKETAIKNAVHNNERIILIDSEGNGLNNCYLDDEQIKSSQKVESRKKEIEDVLCKVCEQVHAIVTEVEADL